MTRYDEKHSPRVDIWDTFADKHEWVDIDGERLLMSEMSDGHLLNSARMTERVLQKNRDRREGRAFSRAAKSARLLTKLAVEISVRGLTPSPDDLIVASDYLMTMGLPIPSTSLQLWVEYWHLRKGDV